MNLDPAKLVVILLVALVVLGPERLPRAARQAGAMWHELTRIRDQVTDEVRSAFPADELPRIPNASRAISGFLGGLKDTASSSNGRADGPSPGASSPPPVAAGASSEPSPIAPDDPSMN